MEWLKKLLTEYIDSIWQQERREIKTEEIISKKFWFIQRLVKKDKINTFRLLEKWFDTQKWYEWVHYHTVSEWNTDLLLMLLAIQDNPLSFLNDLLHK